MGEIVIVGAGERGRVVAYYCKRLELKIAGFVDDTKLADQKINGIPVLGNLDLARSGKIVGDFSFHVAIGDPVARTDISQGLIDCGRDLAQVIHPMTDIAGTVNLGKGLFVAPQSVIGVDCVLGDFVSIGMLVGISADTRIETGASISGGSILGRGVEVGAHTFVGSGTTILPEVRIGQSCVIGAGSLVIKDIPDNSTAFGSPCRVVQENS